MSERATLFDAARQGFDTQRDEHHSRCSTRADEGCDCYARRLLPAHQALDAIQEAVRDAMVVLSHVNLPDPSRDPVIEDAYNRVNLAIQYLVKTGANDE